MSKHNKAGAQKVRAVESEYASFDHLDGTHPWMQAVPTGYVSYRVRELNKGEVTYFNWALAKEMGLIPASHSEKLNTQLHAKLIETFSIQIINEYDELSKRRVDEKTIKPNRYMATRYLQLQHPSRIGKTSGDGRGIWNGTFSHKGKVWDVSSRGTGVTCLAPGTVEAGRPLKTGAADFGYGCGQAEIDELYAAAMMAEIMHLQGIPTERVLCVIDFGNGYGIGVRAAPNLLRPAHMFMYLKQERYDDLKNAVDYFLSRQVTNAEWDLSLRSKYRFDDFVQQISNSFAKFTAYLDIDYIFAWLDWDGDNVLANGAIIDYGSVRQFGARHDCYRYDDVERFSTNLNEQRTKARLLVQVFAQIGDYLKTKEKKPLKSFASHKSVKEFNQKFAEARAQRFLYRLGFNPTQRMNILKHQSKFQEFEKIFSYLERAKISGTVQKVSDGVNHPPLFNLRPILRELPQYYIDNKMKDMPAAEFFKKILSSFAKAKDTRLGNKQKMYIQRFQELYKELLALASPRQKIDLTLKSVSDRAAKLNASDRMTGNALILIVDELLSEVKRGKPRNQIQGIIDSIVERYLGLPEVELSSYYLRKLQPRSSSAKDPIVDKLLNLVFDSQDEI